MHRLLIVMGALALGYALLVLTADFWAIWLWFDSLGVARLLWLHTGAPLMLGLGVAAVAGLVAAANLVLAVRRATAGAGTPPGCPSDLIAIGTL